MPDYSVYPRKDSPYLWISYHNPRTLSRVQESSKQKKTDPLAYKRALDIARTKSEDARAVYSDSSVSAWNHWVAGWLLLKYGAKDDKGDHSGTYLAEKHRWRWIEAYLMERKIFTPAEVSYQTGIDYIPWRQEHKTRSGKGGFNNALGELKMLGRVMREAVRRGFVRASPLERMGLKREKSPEKPDITDEEIALIRAGLKALEGSLPIKERWMTVSFEIGLHQGFRLQETSIPMSQIREAESTITLVQKGDREFTTKLHDGLRPILAQLRAAGAVVTCTIPKMASKQWHWFLKGRKDKGHYQDGVAPRLCFHCTRVTVITRMARAGVPEAQAKAYVGHADSTVHRIYQRLRAQDLSLCTAALSF